jgi:2-C-methyl-D-erythritol 4-phosphate cytidylyltransferase
MTDSHIHGILLAAGQGMRFGGGLPKQYQRLADGRSVIEASIEALLADRRVSGAMVALAPDDAHWDELSLSGDARIRTCEGGGERAMSVLNAVEALLRDHGAAEEDWVVVHDAARPFLSVDALTRLIEACLNSGDSAILAVEVADTVKRVDGDGRIVETLSRDTLRLAQTPQMAPLGLLRAALWQLLESGMVPSDEASALEACGNTVKVIEGDPRNRKITVPGDLPG